jgi:NDP-sugar pyrophosphorylase family protein
MLDRIPDDDTAVRDGFAERVLFPGVIADGLRAQGFVEDLWVDVGAPDRYFRVTRLLLERETARRGRSLLVDDSAEIEPGVGFVGDVMVGAGARIVTGARIIGPSVIGERAVIARGAFVERCIIWEDAQIGEKARIIDSIVAAGASVGAGSVLERGVLADGARVPDAMTLVDAGLMPGKTAADAGS